MVTSPVQNPSEAFRRTYPYDQGIELQANERTQMRANRRYPFECAGREIVERFGKDNRRIRYVWLRSGAAKYRANQQDIHLVLVSGTRAQSCLREGHRAAQKHRRINLTDWERNPCGSRKPAAVCHTFLGKPESARWAVPLLIPVRVTISRDERPSRQSAAATHRDHQIRKWQRFTG